MGAGAMDPRSGKVEALLEDPGPDRPGHRTPGAGRRRALQWRNLSPGEREDRGNRWVLARCAAPAAAPAWDRLLAGASAVDLGLARKLDLFRECGCALTAVEGLVRFGPYDDFADCG